jgi:hypothetical protein
MKRSCPARTRTSRAEINVISKRMRSFLLLALLASLASAFYLPGVAPRDYLYGEAVEMKVNKLDSIHTQLPYDYYSLPFCRPDVIEESAENLGEVLSGDRIENSMYQVRSPFSQPYPGLRTPPPSFSLSLSSLPSFRS